MLTKKNALVAVAVAIVLVGAFLDSSQSAWAQIGPPPPPTCDNKCRHRFYIYFCDGSTCAKYQFLTCLVCNPDIFGGAMRQG
jgi:hypothetical protein